MKKLFLFVAAFVLVAAVFGNSFEFAERSFGELKPSSVDCETADPVNPYSDLVYEATPMGHKCWIVYRKKGELINLPDGSIKSTSSSVNVLAEKYEDMEILKRKWLNPKNVNDNRIKTGSIRGRFNDNNNRFTNWVSGNYYIRIIHSGEAPEIEDVYNYYLDHYPSTFSITESDLDPRRINEYDLERRMEIINNGEKYRHPLRIKQDRYVGIMSQCGYEGEVRAAAGLCRDALIEPDKEPPPGRKPSIGCPIAMTFDSSERKKLWEDLERRARESERLDFDPRSWECTHVGLQWYQRDVLVKLGFTKAELLLMYKTGVPEIFLPEASMDGLFLLLVEPASEP